MVTTTENHNNAQMPSQVQDKLKQAVEQLLASAYELRSSLIDRDLDSIWSNLARQEEEAGKLEEYSQLWGDLNEDNIADDEHRSLHGSISRKLGCLRAVQRSNFVLARSLLTAVDKAMAEGMSSNKGGDGGYDIKGRSHRNGGRLFVSQFG